MNSSFAKIVITSLLLSATAMLTAAQLSDTRVKYLLDDSTGALISIRSVSGAKWPGTTELYEIESLKTVENSTEAADRVNTMKQASERCVQYHCVNPIFPAIVIEKLYTLEDDGSLTKLMNFSSATDKRLVRWISAFGPVERKLPTDPLAHGRYMALLSAGIFAGVNAATNQTLMVERDQVNKRMVMRRSPESPEEDSWRRMDGNWRRMTVFSEFLRPKAAVGARLRYRVADTTDCAVLIRQLADEYESFGFYPKPPPWVGELLADAMYVTSERNLITFVNACAPYPVTMTIWFLNPPWGNWQADSDPPKSSHPDVKGIAPSYRTQMPNVRIAAYTCAAYDDKSDAFRDHPEHILKTREGKLYGSSCLSDHEGRPSYYLRINDPAVRNYLVNMHVGRSREWGFGFHYTDGPGFFHELPDWQTRQVNQSYHWLDYLKELRDGICTINPEMVIFSNGCMPYSAINYIEYCGQWPQLNGADWRAHAVELLRRRLEIPKHNTLVLTYGSVGTEPAFSAYTVFYGGAGNLPMLWRLPYLHAALRTRGATPLVGVLEPRWYMDATLNYEAMLWRKGDAVLVNLLGHEGVPEKVTLRFDAVKAGLEVGKHYRAELLIARPCVPETDNQRNISSAAFAFPEKCSAVVEVTLPAAPMTVSSLKIVPEGL